MLNKEPKRILIFSLVYFPRFIGGAEVAIKEITDRINPLEFEFDMVTLRLDKKLPKFEKIGNINIYRVGFAGRCKNTADSLKFPLYLNKYLLPILGFLKARKLHKKNNYNAMWSMMATYNSFSALFFKIANPEVQFLLTLQEGDPISHIKKRARPVWLLFRKIFQKADKIQAISNYLADFARDMGYQKNIDIVPNAVDFNYFSKNREDEVFEVKSWWKKKPNDVWLITTSRLVVKNAVSDVIKALEKLPSNIHLFIAGEGYQKDMLVDLAEELGVYNRVHFLGHIDHKNLPAYLKASDIFIRPSLSEGFGNSYVEAMAANVPVIATEVGGIIDFIEHKKTGLFVHVNDPTDIALKVEMYLKDLDLRDEIIDNAREMVREKYDWNVVSEQMRGIFKELVK